MIDDGYELLTGMGRDYDRDKFVSSSSCVYGDGSILIKRISRILSIFFFFFFGRKKYVGTYSSKNILCVISVLCVIQ